MSIYLRDTTLVWGSPCQQWRRGQVFGKLDFSKIPEASGIAASKKFSNRLYHINDSENAHSFFITDYHGADTQTIAIDTTTLVKNQRIEEGIY